MYLGIVARTIIIIAVLWTFINIDSFYVERKGLLLRNLIWLVLSLGLPLLAWRGRIFPSQYPFRTDALLISPLVADMGGNMVAGTPTIHYLYWSWADKVAHFWGTGVVAFLIFLLLASGKNYHNNQLRYKPVILLSLVLAGIWELYEYLSDRLYHTVLFDGWQDATGDLTAGLLGTLLCVYLCRRWYKMNLQPEKERYLETTGRLFSPILNIIRKERKVGSEF